MIQSQKMKKKENRKKSEYEYCLICKLNHNQGQRHKYFPNHKNSLSSFLSRFQSKLSDIQFFLNSPSRLRPEHASRNRFRCIFCDAEIDEIDSSFACSNAIKHLSSVDHLKNVKHFLWKYGGEIDRIDDYRISEADVAKWEKKCNAQSEIVSSLGPTNNIHNQIQYGNCDNFGKYNIHSVESSLSIGVLPLQNHTNEYQVSHSSYSGPSNVSNAVSFLHDTTVALHAGSYSGAYMGSSKNLMSNKDSQHCHLNSGRTCSMNGQVSSEGMYRVHQNERTVNEESSSEGMKFCESYSHGHPTLTQISNISSQVSGGNVHTGMLPPWLENSQQSELNVQINSEVGSHASLNKSSKFKKLNPKRVGAAWAEKRKRELEMEKRGEIVESYCDESWLPNFGRVWQSGSRKESRKEFDKEKSKFLKVEILPEGPDTQVNIQPYISKRMRRDHENGDDSTKNVSV